MIYTALPVPIFESRGMTAVTHLAFAIIRTSEVSLRSSQHFGRRIGAHRSPPSGDYIVLPHSLNNKYVWFFP